MKKLFVFLLTCLLFACCLSACNQAPTKVVKKNGQYYLKLNEKVIIDTLNNSDERGVATSMDFDSIDAMTSAIRSGDFTVEVLRELLERDASQSRTGMIELFDLDNLCQPYHPDGITDYSVRYYIGGYESTYEFHNIQTTTGSFRYLEITLLSKEIFGLQFPPLREKGADPVNENIEVYIYDTEINGHTYRVLERWEYGKLAYVTFYVAKEDQYYTIKIGIDKERPTDEWISQFELIPYTPPAMPLWQKIAIGAGVAVVVAGIISAGILLRKRSQRRKYVHSDSEI